MCIRDRCWPKAEHHAAAVLALAFHLDLAHHAVHALIVRHETIEAPLVLHVEADEHEARDARGKAQQVDERVEFVTQQIAQRGEQYVLPVSYTHLRAHETVLDLVCRLLLEKKKTIIYKSNIHTVAHKLLEKH